jgi:hypothetical protein
VGKESRLANYKRLFAPFLVGDANSKGDYAAYCPKHENPRTSKKPSAKINFGEVANEPPVWYCFVCTPTGRESKLSALAIAYKEREDNVVDFSTAQAQKAAGDKPTGKSSYAIPKEPPAPELVQAWHEDLLDDAARLQYLTEERGISLPILKQFQIGWIARRGRYFIPLWRDGKIDNGRLYKPTAERNKYMYYIPRRGLYRIGDMPKDKDVLLPEGEWDLFRALSLGVPAVGHTAGAGKWVAEWTQEFRGKNVYIAYDADAAGRRGREKISRPLAAIANKVFWVNFPDEQDLSETVGTAAELREYMHEAEPVGAERQEEVLPTQGKVVGLIDCEAQENAGLVLQTRALTISQVYPGYAVPCRVNFTCGQDKGAPCSTCVLAALGGTETVELRQNDPIVLEMLDADSKRTTRLLIDSRSYNCSDRVDVAWNPADVYAIEQLVVGQSLNATEPDADTRPYTRTVYSIGTHKTEGSLEIRLVGTSTRDPRNGRSVFTAWVNDALSTSLDTFRLTPELYERLGVFRPAGSQTPLEKCREIADELALSVTNIYGKPELHIGYDLVCHSVLDFNVFGKPIDKGWLEGLVIGDTRTGKSQVGTRLIQHYQNGVLKTCEGATFAGLVGGIDTVGNSWIVNWGLLPQSDRRMVILDEMSGLYDSGIIDKMSSIRSSGVAEINKIKKAYAKARVRLMWISNPVSKHGRQAVLDPYGYTGVEALRDLVRTQEDMARFDFVLSVHADPAEGAMINASHPVPTNPVYNTELCSALLLWAWSRTPADVIWVAGAEAALRAAAVQIGKQYVADPPLVQVQSVRMKLARLAVAIAARTFATSDGRRLLIRKKHVAAAVEFLHSIYSSPVMGYRRHSKKEHQLDALGVKYFAQATQLLAGDSRGQEELGSRARLLLSQAVGRRFLDGRTYDGECKEVFDRLVAWGLLRGARGVGYEISSRLLEIISKIEDKARSQR